MEEQTGMQTGSIDVSIPRRMFWADKLVNKKKCPLCHSTLMIDYQSYVVALRSGNETMSFMTGNEYGSFCPECPLVVLDRKGFEQIIGGMIEQQDWRISGALQYFVMGIVDKDAIPEDKKHLPPGGEDNPIPIVKFLQETNIANKGGGERHKGKRLSGNRRRRRR